MINIRRNSLGFTLIELLVVVLIIGVLASVALPQYRKAVLKSRVARVWPTLRTLDQAINSYCMANPGDSDTISEDKLDVSVPSGFQFSTTSCTVRSQYPYEATAYYQFSRDDYKFASAVYDNLVVSIRDGKRNCGNTTEYNNDEVASLCKMLGMKKIVSTSSEGCAYGSCAGDKVYVPEVRAEAGVCSMPSHNCFTE